MQLQSFLPPLDTQGHCQTKQIIYQRLDEGSLQEQTFSKYKDMTITKQLMAEIMSRHLKVKEHFESQLHVIRGMRHFDAQC